MPVLWSLLQASYYLRKRVYHYLLSCVLQYLGEDTDIDPTVVFESPDKIRIENGCRIGRGARLIGTSLETTGIHLGPLIRIRPYVHIYAYGGKVTLGRRVTIGEGSVVCGHGGLTIGENTMISWLCSIIPGNHIFDRVDIPLRLQGEERLGVRIGKNAWIGSNATIVDGVSIGDDAVIGAGAVVTRDIPDWAVAVGVPARVIRDRRDPRDKNKLRIPAKIPTGESITTVDDISEDFDYT